MKNIVIMLTLLILSSLTLTTPSEAQVSDSVAAMVVAARGSVVAISPDGTSRELKTKSNVYAQDTIDTGKTGKIQLMFKDNTLISLGRKTAMKIAEYNWDQENKKGNLKTEVKEGTFRIMGGSLAKYAPQNFKTITPSATIGIRGSMYTGSILKGRLSVVFQGGKGIEITNPQGAVVITKPGYGTSVATPNARPAKPTKFTAKDLENLNSNLANGDPDKNEESGNKEEAGGSDEQQDKQDENAVTDNDEEASSDNDDGSSADSQSNPDEDESTEANEPEAEQTSPEEDEGSAAGNNPPPEEDPAQQTANEEPASEPSADTEPAPAPEPAADTESAAVPEPVAAPEPIAAPEPVAVPEPVAAPEPVSVPIPIPEPPPIDIVDPDQQFIDAAIAAKDKAIAAATSAGNATANTFNATTLTGKLNAQQAANDYANAAQTAANDAASAAANTTDPEAQTAKDDAQAAANSALTSKTEAYNNYQTALTKTNDATNAYNFANAKLGVVQTKFQEAIQAPDLASRASSTSGASTAAAAAHTAANNAQTAANATNVIEAQTFANNAATAATTATQKYNELVSNTIPISGKFLSMAVDTINTSGTNDKVWLGQVDGNTIFGHPLTKSSDSGAPFADGSFFPFAYTNPFYSPTPVYDDFNIEHDYFPFHVHVHNKDYYFNGDVMSSPFDEFYAYALPDVIFTDGIDYHFGMEGFAGVESTSLPTDGTDSYFGGFISAVTSQATSNIDLRNGWMLAETNWKNRKIFGFLKSTVNGQHESLTYFYGDLSGTSITNVKIVGSGFNQSNNEVFATTGGANFAQFYGSVNQGFGFTASGANYNMANQADLLSNWDAVGSAFKFVEHDPFEPLPVGETTWRGYFTGLSENMNSSADREVIMNNDSSLFTFTIDRDAGTISGTMSSGGTTGDLIFNNIGIGGTYGSAYIDKDMFIAELGCSTDCIEKYVTPTTLNTSLKTYGNFMTTAKPNDWDFSIDTNDNPILVNTEDSAKKIRFFEADGTRLFPLEDEDYQPLYVRDENGNLIYDQNSSKIPVIIEEQFAEYATWGYWEAAYTMNGQEYHLHMPGSLWIAGKETPIAHFTDTLDPESLIPHNIIGRYVGGAQGIKIDATGTSPLIHGVTEITVDFANLAAAGSLSGSISFQEQISTSFQEKTLTIQSAASQVGITGFSFSLNPAQNIGLDSGEINGKFYGDYAKSIGGNFRADFNSGTEKYIGVFGGDRPSQP